MEKKKPLFRKEVLEHISSPEQLDHLIHIVKPRGWIALITFLLIVFFTILWLIFGNVTTTINGQSVLMKTGGILTIASNVGGRISDITVTPGELIAKGQTIARIEQPELRNKLYLMREEAKDKKASYKEQVALYQKQEHDLQDRVSDLTERFNVYSDLMQRGIVTKKDYLDIKVGLKEAATKLHELKNKRLKTMQKQQEFTRNLNIMTDKLDEYTRVISPYNGRVIDVEVTYDTLVKKGTPLIHIEPSGRTVQNLEAVIFIEATHGKKIKPGMQVNISPYAIKSEEYGSMVGRVTNVSTYPATFQSMMNVLRNDELVKQLLKQGVLVAVKATLVPDKNTYSGYKWTSPGGPPVKIQSGSLGRATIVTKEQKPYTLIVPTTKKITGL